MCAFVIRNLHRSWATFYCFNNIFHTRSAKCIILRVGVSVWVYRLCDDIKLIAYSDLQLSSSQRNVAVSNTSDSVHWFPRKNMSQTGRYEWICEACVCLCMAEWQELQRMKQLTMESVSTPVEYYGEHIFLRGTSESCVQLAVGRGWCVRRRLGWSKTSVPCNYIVKTIEIYSNFFCYWCDEGDAKHYDDDRSMGMPGREFFRMTIVHSSQTTCLNICLSMPRLKVDFVEDQIRR